MRPATGSPVVSLIGMPGSGKTSIGRRLASRLDVRFVDLDHVVEQRAGRSISQVFADLGEAEFRRLEAEELARSVGLGSAVLATGGGAVLREANRDVLRRATVPVYLMADVAGLWRRLERSSKRPLLSTGNPYASLCELFEQRRPLYAELAAITVDTAGTTAPRIVQRIVEDLKEHGWAAVA